MTSSRARSTPSIPPLEWVCAAIGCVVVIGLVAWLAHRAITPGGSPPDVRAEHGAIEHGAGGWRVDVRVWNAGGSTAENVIVRGELRLAGDEIATSQAELPYVPSGSERHVALVFRDDPATGALTIGVSGYVRP